MIMLAGENDISNLISNVTWSGDKDQISRKLAFTYLYTDQENQILRSNCHVWTWHFILKAKFIALTKDHRRRLLQRCAANLGS